MTSCPTGIVCARTEPSAAFWPLAWASGQGSEVDRAASPVGRGRIWARVYHAGKQGPVGLAEDAAPGPKDRVKSHFVVLLCNPGMSVSALLTCSSQETRERTWDHCSQGIREG